MLQDVRFALRQLARSPAFALAAILTLALAIGANVAIFSAADAVLLHPLPYPTPDQLIVLQETLPAHSLKDIAPSPQDFANFRRSATSLAQIAAMISGDASLSEGAPEDVDEARVTAGLFPMLGIVPMYGSLFTADQEQPGNDHVAILSESLWARRYGADPSIIGRNIKIDRESYRVIGVVRTRSVYRAKTEIWLPLAFRPAEIAAGTRGPHYVQVFGRLRQGTSVEQARAEFRTLARRIVEQYPNWLRSTAISRSTYRRWPKSKPAT
jgi:putative ABC transport system permease protein